MPTFAVHDPHSYGNTDDVVVSHLSLDMTVDFDRRRLDGVCELTLVWSEEAADSVDLDTNGLFIASVTDPSGRALQYELGDPHPFMGCRLRIFAPAQPDNIRVAYHTHPDAGATRSVP